MTPKDFKVGQELWYVGNRHRRDTEECKHTVIHIGRKWITTVPTEWMDAERQIPEWHKERFDPATMLADGRGYTYPGQFWLSQEAYKHQLEVDDAWLAVKKLCSAFGPMPEHLTLNDLQGILDILNNEKKER